MTGKEGYVAMDVAEESEVKFCSGRRTAKQTPDAKDRA